MNCKLCKIEEPTGWYTTGISYCPKCISKKCMRCGGRGLVCRMTGPRRVQDEVCDDCNGVGFFR